MSCFFPRIAAVKVAVSLLSCEVVKNVESKWFLDSQFFNMHFKTHSLSNTWLVWVKFSELGR